MNGQLLIFGDVHGVIPQVRIALDSARYRGITNVLQVGDFGAFSGPTWEYYVDTLDVMCKARDLTLYFIRGNHDDPFLLNSYPDIPDFPGAKEVRSRVIYLTDNTQFDWNGKTVTIQGGAYSVDRKWRTLGKSYWQEEVITKEQEDAAFKLPKTTDILFCHDSPAGAPNLITDHPDEVAQGTLFFGEQALLEARHNRLALQRITERLQPELIVHGHYHRYMQYLYNLSTGKECRILGLDEGGGLPADFIRVLDPDTAGYIT